MESNTDRSTGFPYLQENLVRLKLLVKSVTSFDSKRKQNALFELSWDDSDTQEYCSNRIGLVVISQNLEPVILATAEHGPLPQVAVLGKYQIGVKISVVTGPWQCIATFLYSGIRNF